jgi:hypothetical protein
MNLIKKNTNLVRFTLIFRNFGLICFVSLWSFHSFEQTRFASLWCWNIQGWLYLFCLDFFTVLTLLSSLCFDIEKFSLKPIPSSRYRKSLHYWSFDSLRFDSDDLTSWNKTLYSIYLTNTTVSERLILIDNFLWPGLAACWPFKASDSVEKYPKASTVGPVHRPAPTADYPCHLQDQEALC